MTLCEYKLETPKQNFCNITPQVREAVSKSGAAVRDLLFALDKTFLDRPEFRHSEGKTAVLGLNQPSGVSCQASVTNMRNTRPQQPTQRFLSGRLKS
ncbi:MAG: hypothetical protein LBQ16_02100 [Gracilibacteraceae bacterium]|jgi:hypothetical protein|nr:hypothetical protein [Gracilibacteraceae bacterium]